jgi:putative ABC transport system permease protein
MHDLRLAFRALRAAPIVSAVAMISLALGIGANTAIFSLVNSVMLGALPVPGPERLAILTSGPVASRAWSYAIWEELRQRSQLFDGAVAWTMVRFNLAQSGEVQLAEGLLVSGDYFNVLGVPPLLGRTFTASDDLRGGGSDGAVAVISYAFWQRHYGGASEAIGARLTVEGVPFTVVGVTPPEFFGTEVGRWFDIAVPIGTEPIMRGRASSLDQRASSWLNVMIRVKPGQSLASATAALRAVQPQVRDAAMPPEADSVQQAGFLKAPFSLTPAANGLSRLRGQYAGPLLTLFVIAALVLLIACANIANLLLARATTRQHELSVRVALGASRGQLVRLLFAESAVLAAAGAAAGLLLAPWVSHLLVSQLVTTTTPVTLDLSLDWRVLAFTGSISVATAVLFGTAPAFRAARVAPIDALKQREAATALRASGDRHGGVSSALIVTQVALSLVLAVAAGLFVRTFARLATTPLGFDADRVIVANINATRSSTPMAARFDLYQRIANAVDTVPGVAAASGSLITPVTGQNWTAPLIVPGAPELSDQDRATSINVVTPGWFATYGIPMVTGRDFDERDRGGAERVAIVNEEFAARFFPEGRAIGGRVAFPAISNVTSHEPRTIVGIVSDAVYSSLREPQRPALYEPLAQNDWPFPFAGISLSVRSTEGTPTRLARSIGTAITNVDPNLAFSLRSVRDQVSASLVQERLVAILSGFFSLLAVLLAGIGLYGVTSNAVTRRRVEIGIRMALGANQADVVRLVLKRVVTLVTIGILVGAGVSLWASKFVSSLIYGLQPRDPVALIGAAMTLAAVGALAGWLPAYRASRIDPAGGLREN